MRKSVIAIATVMVLGSAQASDEFVPITIDGPTMNQIIAQLDQIPMPGFAYRQVIGIFQELEKRAQAQARAQAKAEKGQ